MRIHKRTTYKMLLIFIHRRKYRGLVNVMGIPESLVNNPKTELSAMWKIIYRELKEYRKKHPEKQCRITGIGATSYITDKPKKGGTK